MIKKTQKYAAQCTACVLCKIYIYIYILVQFKQKYGFILALRKAMFKSGS